MEEPAVRMPMVIASLGQARFIDFSKGSIPVFPKTPDVLVRILVIPHVASDIP
jgi:hypothetical protein